MKLLYAPMMMVLLIRNPGLTSAGPSGTDLKGKMFTLTPAEGGISFYAPSFPPPPTSWPFTTPHRRQRYNTTRPPTTSPTPTTTGVSVCLRFLPDYQSFSEPTLFTLSPSTSPLTLRVYRRGVYALAYDYHSKHNLLLTPDISLWSTTHREIWTRVCVTVDAVKNVAQMFSNTNMSVRKMLSARYVWSGEPVIDLPGFVGQVTDVQVWDYPLRYKEVFNYVTSSYESSPDGSVLSWSSISYSLRGRTLLEDIYERQLKQPISSHRTTEQHPQKPVVEKKGK